MDLDISSSLLKRLCCHVTGMTGERALEKYQLVVMLLTDHIGTEPTSDCTSITNEIKRWLVHENRLQDTTRFSFLLNKLQRSLVLRNKAAILQLFLCLRHHNLVPSKAESDSFSISPLDTVRGFTNGHGPFRTPSLHSSSTSQGSSESFPSSNSLVGLSHEAETVREGLTEKRSKDTRCGRVARLAAMYKGTLLEADCEKVIVEGRPVTNPNFKTIASKPATKQLPSKQSTKKEWTSHADIAEDVLIREILFAFQGIEGKIIKMDTAKDCFKIDPKIRLSCGQRDLIAKLVEIGWLYDRVKRFCETHGRSLGGGGATSETQHKELFSAGLVNQSLVLALKEELNEYCRLIAVLESQMHDVTGAESPSSEGIGGGQTLRRLLLWTLEPRCRLRTLALVANAVKNVKGGASASAVYKHLHHGDASHVQVVRRALSQACRPLFVMLTEWLLDGELRDPHREFFIGADPAVPDERLWHEKYDIRWSMLPSFISHKLALKILVSGKSLEFLRTVCNFKSPLSFRDAIKTALQKTTVESLFNHDESNQLDDLVSLTFRSTSSHVLEEILSRHKLLAHLTALRRYLLLGQGDFIHYLMEILEPELCKPANSLHPHNLSYLLETAIAASNAQYEESDILRRLDVRLLECSPGETGWDVFSLDYHVDGPIGTVFTTDCMRQYLMLFNTLWRAKHIECILSATWKQQAATSKLCRCLPELGGPLHHIQLLLTEMIHLVQQMAYYMTFEVLECSWHALINQLASAQSLDDVITAHLHFLKRIVAGALLGEESRDVRTHLRTLYDLMVRLETLQERLYNAVVCEINARKAAELAIEERTKSGHFGTSADLDELEQTRRNEFSYNFVPGFRTDLKILIQSYQDMVQSFLLMLAQHEDENLHLLSTRLDFNEYYHRKDHRLNMRLTYLHKRKSMGASFLQSDNLTPSHEGSLLSSLSQPRHNPSHTSNPEVRFL